MKVLLELENEPKKSDILRFNGSKWECVSPLEYIAELKQKMANLEEELKTTNNNMQVLVDGVNKKLEEYHKILQNIVKEQ